MTAMTFPVGYHDLHPDLPEVVALLMFGSALIVAIIALKLQCIRRRRHPCVRSGFHNNRINQRSLFIQELAVRSLFSTIEPSLISCCLRCKQ